DLNGNRRYQLDNVYNIQKLVKQVDTSGIILIIVMKWFVADMLQECLLLEKLFMKEGGLSSIPDL
ncbi:hypothetical protein CFK44_24965, partial [Escherichia coli O157]